MSNFTYNQDFRKLYVPMSDGIHAVRVKKFIVQYSCYFCDVVQFVAEIAMPQGAKSKIIDYDITSDVGKDERIPNFYLSIQEAKVNDDKESIIRDGYCKLQTHISNELFYDTSLLPDFINCEYSHKGNFIKYGYSYKWNGYKAVIAYPKNLYGYNNYVFDILNRTFLPPIDKYYKTAEECEQDNNFEVFEFEN